MSDQARFEPQLGLSELWVDQTDGTYARKFATSGGSGVTRYNPVIGLTEKWVSNGDGTYSLLVSAGSSGAAGSDKQVQYNASGAFAADANMTWDYTAQTLTIVGKFGNGCIFVSNGTFQATLCDGTRGINAFDGTNGATLANGTYALLIGSGPVNLGSSTLTIRGIGYTWPTTIASAGSVLTSPTGSGVLAWSPVVSSLASGGGTITVSAATGAVSIELPNLIAPGTYTVGIGVTTNGTITVDAQGRITAIQEAT